MQISTPIYCMGATAEDILKSFSLSAEDSKKFHVVKGKVNGTFRKENVIFERAQSYRRQQKEDESSR